MSRSRKKVFGSKDSNSYMKRMANRKVRRTYRVQEDDMGFKGNTYRKVFESYDISDWKMLFFSERSLKDFYSEWYDAPLPKTKTWATAEKDPYVKEMVRKGKTK